MNNVYQRCGGDSLIVGYSDFPIVQLNSADYSGYGVGLDCQCVCGIWGYNTNNAVFQFNEVSNTVLFTGDGEAWDFDWGTMGTCVYQYNYSHDNQGGVCLQMCDYDYPGGSATFNPIFRYNISQNDHNGCFYNLSVNRLTAYNNVIYNPDGVISQNGSGECYYNNIFVGNSNSDNGWYSANNTYSFNCYYRHTGPSDAYKINADPQFVNPGSGGSAINTVDGYKLQATSPCINTGTLIKNNGGRDFWRCGVNCWENRWKEH